MKRSTPTSQVVVAKHHSGILLGIDTRELCKFCSGEKELARKIQIIAVKHLYRMRAQIDMRKP